MSTPIRGFPRVADEVFRILRERIVGGELPPGTRLDIDAIATGLAVSRTPVREAVLQLEGIGLLERQPYRGPVVTGVDPGRLEEVTALRIQLEGLAAELGTPRLGAADLARMRSILDELDARAGDPDFALGVFNDLNTRFHRTIYDAADAPVLGRILDALSVEADRLRLHYDFTATFADPQHRQILAACERRDAVAVRDLTRRHILEAYFVMIGAREVGEGILATALRESATPLHPDGSSA